MDVCASLAKYHAMVTASNAYNLTQHESPEELLAPLESDKLEGPACAQTCLNFLSTRLLGLLSLGWFDPCRSSQGVSLEPTQNRGDLR